MVSEFIELTLSNSFVKMCTNIIFTFIVLVFGNDNYLKFCYYLWGKDVFIFAMVTQNIYDSLKIILTTHDIDPNMTLLNTTRSLLWYSCKCGHIKIAQLLIEHGANINQSTTSGSTPLIISAQFGRTEMIELLLSYKNIDVNARRYDNYSALDLAVFFNNVKMVQILLDNGAEYIKDHALDNRSNAMRKLITYNINMNNLNEWRPWNNNTYPSQYRNACQSLLILAKATID